MERKNREQTRIMARKNIEFLPLESTRFEATKNSDTNLSSSSSTSVSISHSVIYSPKSPRLPSNNDESKSTLLIEYKKSDMRSSSNSNSIP